MRTPIALLGATIFFFAFSVMAAESRECAETFRGGASFYADEFHGKRTASGARLNNNAYTCAHRTLPFGTKVLVENPKNGSKCVVTVTDRGPFHSKRVIDLTKAAARKLGITGIGKVVCFTGNLLGSGADKVAKTTGTVAKGLLWQREKEKQTKAIATTTTTTRVDTDM